MAFYQQRAQRRKVCSHTLDAKGSADCITSTMEVFGAVRMPASGSLVEQGCTGCHFVGRALSGSDGFRHFHSISF